MFVYKVMSTGLVTAKKTDTIRSAVMKMLNCYCGTIPVVEGDNQLVGMITLREGLLPPSKGIERILSPVQKQMLMEI